MNKELYDELGRRIDAIEVEKARIIREFNEKQRNNSFSNNARKIKAGEKAQAKVIELNEKKNVYSIARKNVEFAVAELKKARTQEEREKAKTKLKNANLKMQEIADEDGILYDNEEHEVKSVNEPKKQNNSNLVAWGLVLAIIAGCITVGVKGCDPKEPKSIEQAVDDKDNKDSITFDKANSKESVVSEDNNEKITEQLPKAELLAKKYGMTTKFTDASNEKQLDSRVNDIYANYVDTPSAGYATTVELSQDRLANCIRICNGEFMQKDGEVTYNEENVIEAANTIATYANSTSYLTLGSNLEFKPLSVFFEEDTIAYKIVSQNDELMSKIYADIKANDAEQFRADSIKWGEFIRDTFIYPDINRDVISIFSVDDAQKYEVAACLLAPYESSIGEFSRSIAITNPNFAICVPLCTTGKTADYNNTIALSKLVYAISDTKINALAERAGIKEEWDKNNDPILIQCKQFTQQYFNDKYYREIGCSKKLK